MLFLTFLNCVQIAINYKNLDMKPSLDVCLTSTTTTTKTEHFHDDVAGKLYFIKLLKGNSDAAQNTFFLQKNIIKLNYIKLPKL